MLISLLQIVKAIETYLIAPEKLTFECILDYFESRVIFLRSRVFHLEGKSKAKKLKYPTVQNLFRFLQNKFFGVKDGVKQARNSDQLTLLLLFYDTIQSRDLPFTLFMMLLLSRKTRSQSEVN